MPARGAHGQGCGIVVHSTIGIAVAGVGGDRRGAGIGLAPAARSGGELEVLGHPGLGAYHHRGVGFVFYRTRQGACAAVGGAAGRIGTGLGIDGGGAGGTGCRRAGC